MDFGTGPISQSFTRDGIMSDTVSYQRTVWRPWCLAVVLASVFPAIIPAFANDDSQSAGTPNDDLAAEAAGTPAETAPRPLRELEAECEKTDGLLDLWRDLQTGEVYVLVRADQLDKPLVYFTYTESGVSRFHLGRGIFRDQRILKITRDYHRLRFRFEPTRYYFDLHSPLRFSADANVSPAIVAAEKIVAWNDEQTTFAVSADKLLLSETFHQLKPAEEKAKSRPKQFRLGELSTDKSRFRQLRGYPKNIDLVVEYVYEDQSPVHHADKDEGVTDSRYVTITVQHSIIEVPDDGYQPRRDDPRVGYFSHQVDDMTSTSATPYRDFIHRWHLKRVNPDAPRGPPQEPIVWWLERTTPREFRETIREAVLAWNEAFDQAGFENAVDVRIQPDDAAWDAGDIRYNVIRWTSSPAPVFGGYGPSFVDPRSGRILGADIMLEWVFVTKRVKYRELFQRPPNAMGSQITGSSCLRDCLCTLSAEMQVANLFGRQVLALRGAAALETDELLKQSLYYLVLHEVGHTLGLSHNFKASQLHDLEQIHNGEVTAEFGVTSSVMEYPNINLAPLDRAQGMYYTTRPGPYDKWAIEYGYSPGVDDLTAEEERLNQILARSTRPELAFANDADDMRRPGRGIDPGAMIFDMTSDPIGWADERLALVRHLADNLLKNYQEPGKSYHELRDRFTTLLVQFKTAARVVARYPGGICVDRALAGQADANLPLRPVSQDQQKRAVQVLANRVFAPDAFVLSPELLSHLQKQRRGFDHFEENEDLKIHDEILAIYRDLLDQLLHRDVLKRVTDSSLYGNSYPLHEYLTELTVAVFAADADGDVPTVRQILQTEYVRRLTRILDGRETHGRTANRPEKPELSFDSIAQSHALDQLFQIEARIERALNGNGGAATTSHRKHLKWLIQKRVKSEE